MEPTGTAEVLAQLSQYLDGRTSVDDLQHWLVPLVWEPEELDAESEELVNAIQLRLAEFTSGHLDESELRTELESLLPETRTLTSDYTEQKLSIRSGSVAQAIRFAVRSGSPSSTWGAAIRESVVGT